MHTSNCLSVYGLVRCYNSASSTLVCIWSISYICKRLFHSSSFVSIKLLYYMSRSFSEV